MWNAQAFAWQWESGRLVHQVDFGSLSKKEDEKEAPKSFNPLSFVPIPVATLTFAGLNILNTLRKSKIVFTAASLTSIPAVLMTDVAITLAMAYYEFQKANQNAVEYALELSKELHLLRSQYKKVRVVAHSLGCKHLIGMFFHFHT